MAREGGVAVVLGAGFVGKRLVQALVARGGFKRVVYTHRCLADHSPISGAVAVQFDLSDESTWSDLPHTIDFCVVTMPMKPMEQVRLLQSRVLSSSKLAVVYGSTSCYTGFPDHADVSEETELDMEQERVAGEEYLRLEGATLLVLSGIHGYEREVRRWFEGGRIHGSNRLLNLIHCDDIVAATLAAWDTRERTRGMRINVSDGRKRWTDDMAAKYKAPDAVVDGCRPTRKRTSKVILNEKLRTFLLPRHTFADVD